MIILFIVALLLLCALLKHFLLIAFHFSGTYGICFGLRLYWSWFLLL